jgi:hypothetical protein
MALSVCVLVTRGGAQQAGQPPVKVNVLNVCTPSSEEQKEMAAALAQIPRNTKFSSDFEVDRGRSTLSGNVDFLRTGAAQVASDNSTADWVRIRRDFPASSMFSTVQYSFSVDPKNMIETLVFHVREPKDLSQISIEDTASAVTSPAAMLGTNTPANRIKLERFGKSSVALARCGASETGPAPDQSIYEPLFQSATTILQNYRASLQAQKTVPDELGRVHSLGSPRMQVKTKPVPQKAVNPQN